MDHSLCEEPWGGGLAQKRLKPGERVAGAFSAWEGTSVSTSGQGPPVRTGERLGHQPGLQVTHTGENAVASSSSPGHPRSVPRYDDTWDTVKEPALQRGQPERGLIKSTKVLNWDFVFKIPQMSA